MKKSYFLFSILTILIFVALFTNPSLERQKEIVREEVKLFVQKDLRSPDTGQITDLLGGLGSSIERFIGEIVLDPIVETMISSDNYVLFSTTKINWEDEQHIIGVAAFNNIFFLKKIEDLNNELLMNK